MKQVKLLRSNPTENGSSPREMLILNRGGNNMEKQVVNENTIQLIDECQFGDGVRFDKDFEEKARMLQAMLVEDIEGTINALVLAYEENIDYSREVVADLVTAIREINNFDFVVDESGFSEVFRANETLNEVFVVDETEDKYEFVDENFGEDFI